eukprot:1178612-Prorocentrum_minimum.AAC.1
MCNESCLKLRIGANKIQSSGVRAEVTPAGCAVRPPRPHRAACTGNPGPGPPQHSPRRWPPPAPLSGPPATPGGAPPPPAPPPPARRRSSPAPPLPPPRLQIDSRAATVSGPRRCDTIRNPNPEVRADRIPKLGLGLGLLTSNKGCSPWVAEAPPQLLGGAGGAPHGH